MPGPVLTISSTVQCAHVGSCKPVNPMPRVRIAGQAVVTLSTAYTVANCQATSMSGGNLPPCLSAQFTMVPSERAFTTTGPLLTQLSNGTSLPNGTPLVVAAGQIKVIAS
jgi:hypothetical protein